MVIVTLDDGRKRGTLISQEVGFRQADGTYRVCFKDMTTGIVTENPAPEGTEEGIIEEKTN